MTETPKLSPDKCAQHVTATIRTVLHYGSPTAKTMLHLQSSLIKFEQSQGYKISSANSINPVLWEKITTANTLILNEAEKWAAEHGGEVVDAINNPKFEDAMQPKLDAMIGNSPDFQLLKVAIPAYRNFEKGDDTDFVGQFILAFQPDAYNPALLIDEKFVAANYSGMIPMIFGSKDSYTQIRLNAQNMMRGEACGIDRTSVSAIDLTAPITAEQIVKR